MNQSKAWNNNNITSQIMVKIIRYIKFYNHDGNQINCAPVRFR